MSVKKVYILLTHSGSFPSRVIKVFSRKPYTHVSIALDPSLHTLYSFGRKRPNNPLIGGFITESIGGICARFKDTTYRLYECSVDEDQYEQLRLNLRRFEANRDKFRYSFLGVAGTAMGMPIVRQHHYFCSQFVARILIDSGIQIINKPWALVTPDDFRKSEQLQLVSEGLLCRSSRQGSSNPVQDAPGGRGNPESNR